MGETTENISTPEAETARICRELIRFDTSNYSSGEAEGERAAAEHVAELIQEVGLETQYFESAPGRANVFTRLEGSDPTAGALLVHGHLDVVPAMACLLYTSPSPRDLSTSRMPSSA